MSLSWPTETSNSKSTSSTSTSTSVGKEATLVHTLISGMVGGISMVVVGHPLDLVKVRQQTHTTSPPVVVNPTTSSGNGVTATVRGLTSIVKLEGFRGLYRGLATPLLAVAPTFAVEYGAFEFFQGWLKSMEPVRRQDTVFKYRDELFLSGRGENSKEPSSIWQVATAGALSAIPATAFVAPAERLKCLIQAAPPSSSHHQGLLTWAWRESGGLRGLYTGTLATLLRDMPGAAAYFATYHASKRLLTQPNVTSPSPFSIMLAGGLAGVANWMVAIPADVIKSLQQSARYGDHQLGFLATGYQLIRREGLRGLFKGLTPALIRAFPANAACFLGIEATLSLMGVTSH